MTKKVFQFLSISILIAAVAVPLSAQSISFTANIPFDFVLSGKTMPAGEYAVSIPISPNVLWFGSTGRSAVANVVSIPVQAKDNRVPETGKLVFRRYGSQYFLAEIWRGHSSKGREIPESRTERELSKRASVGQRQTVVVLAQGRIPDPPNILAR
jgi:hypothetical protein